MHLYLVLQVRRAKGGRAKNTQVSYRSGRWWFRYSVVEVFEKEKA